MSKRTFDESDIIQLQLPEAVRVRPALYFGGLMHYFQSLFAETWPDVIAGVCTRIDVEVGEDGSFRIADDGAPYATTREMFDAVSVPPAATRLGVVGRPQYDWPSLRRKSLPGQQPLLTGWFIEPGIWSIVAARIEIESLVDGVRLRKSLSPPSGVVEVADKGSSFPSTMLTVQPDYAVLWKPDDRFFAELRTWLNARTIMMPGLTVRLKTPACADFEVFHCPGGILGHFERRLREEQVIFPTEPFRFHRLAKDAEGVAVEVFLWWDLHSRVNEVFTNAHRVVHEGDGTESWALRGPFSRGLRAGMEFLHYELAEGSPPPAGANFVARIDIDEPQLYNGDLSRAEPSNKELYLLARDMVVEQLPRVRGRAGTS